MTRSPRVVVAAPAVLDTVSAPALGQELEAADADAHLVVDCSGVEFMDSSGLTVLVVTHNRLEAGGGALSVASPSEPVVRLLELTGLAFLIGGDDGG